MQKRFIILGILVLAFGLVLAACGGSPEPAPQPEPLPVQVECPECPPLVCPEPAPCPDCPEPPPCPEPAVADVPFEAEWLASGHGDALSRSFTYWDGNDPAVIPVACAKCHSATGYHDFLGLDGSEAGVVNADHPVGATVSCVACHNAATVHKDSVVFPSGIEIFGLGGEARCMDCHQGRQSTVSVDGAIERVGLTAEPDTVSPDLSFLNIHYYAAAATQYGTLAKGGYEYQGKSYDTKFFHAEGYDTCTSCHDAHTLAIDLVACQTCHPNVNSIDDLAAIRLEGSEHDYDGDGDVTEGVLAEIEGLQSMLYGAIQAYAREVSGTPIVYYPDGHPYFFIDLDGDGQVSEGEAVGANRYNAWTPRSLKAAYNYQVSKKDPGKFAHNGKYIIQLLYDSIEDLNTALSQPVDLSNAHRIDPGHFAGSEVAFRYWDAQGVVPATCATCHTADGLPFFLKNGVQIAQEPSNGLKCTTCHTNYEDYALHQVDTVTFPSGARLELADKDDNLCLVCHQGRESTVSVNRLTAGIGADTVPETALRFLNIHYFSAGATLFGSEAQGAYQYEGNTYIGRFEHVPSFATCTQCHSTHALEVQADKCAICHASVTGPETLATIRTSTADYDGDGDTSVGIAAEIDAYRDKLYAAIQAYAADFLGKPIVYDSHSHPYYFNDLNANGVADPDEAVRANQFTDWTPRLLKAAYNYQYASKDPGGYSHNARYLIQVLYDSLVDLRNVVPVDMAGMVRPD